MVYAAYIAAIIALVALAWLTGVWRILLTPFKIPARKMTVAQLGLRVPDQHVERVNTLLRCFTGGFNTIITSPSSAAWERYAASAPSFGRPFAHEGAAMGLALSRFFRYDPADFEARFPQRHPGFRYLHHVGLGFWSGMRGHSPDRLAALLANLDPLHRELAYDGYGFKHAFFDYPKDRKRCQDDFCGQGLRPLDDLPDQARSAAYQGVGRAFFFLFMADPELLVQHAQRFPEHETDIAAGVGLASAFIFSDQLEVALELAAKWPTSWHDHIHLGMCFGLKARSINDPDQFDASIARLQPAVQEAVRASIECCDRIERQERTAGAPDAYHRWRAGVTQWMANQLDYPLAACRAAGATSTGRPAVTA